ncbi:hypothetical protein ACGE24_07600 [Corynebacterium kroppenstedtii]
MAVKLRQKKKKPSKKGLLEGTIPDIASMDVVDIDRTVTVEKNNETAL